MLIPGSFDQTGSPILRIKVCGDLGEKEYGAVIDTGCTGFVVLPFDESKPLGLRIGGDQGNAVASVTLANGAQIYNYVADAIVTLGDQAESGTVVLDDTGNDVLVGMDFLRKFKLGLILTENIVILYDGRETMAAVAEFMATAPQGLPVPEIGATPQE